MRIVIDMQGAQTESRFRGIGRYTLSLAQAMARHAGTHEIWLALNARMPENITVLRDAFSDLIPKERIRIFDVPCSNNHESWGTLAAEKIREHFLASLAPDVVVVASVFEGYRSKAVTSIGTFSNSYRTAAVLYDLIPFLNQEQYLSTIELREFYYRKVDWLKNADLLLAISEHSRQEGIQHLAIPVDHVVNISTAVGTQFRPVHLDPAATQKLLTRMGITRKMVMYAPGGFDPRKNFDRLIEAYSHLPKSIRDAHQLVIVSKLQPPQTHALIGMRDQCGLRKDELILTGYVEDDDLIALYSLADLFVFPSMHEGFGLPVLEAMACGAAVIGSNRTSIPEVIGWENALFDPLSVASISQKIAQALTDADFMEQLRQHGLRQARKFTWDVCAMRAIEALEVLCARNEVQDLARDPGLEFQRLIESLVKIRSKKEPMDQVLLAAANSIAFNSCLGKRQLLLDISTLVHTDAKSGIQRVVRSLLRELFMSPPNGIDVQPIYFDRGVYRYANCFCGTMLGCAMDAEDSIVDFCQDDVYLSLDLNMHLTSQVHDTHVYLRERGIELYFIVYDILLVLHPEWWPEGAGELFDAWLRSISKVATGLICISEAVAEEVRCWLGNNPPERITGPSVSSFHLGADIKSSLPSKGIPDNAQIILAALNATPSFLMVGTVEPRKGHAQTLAAFELLWEQGINVNLVTVGNRGWLVDQLVDKFRQHPELNQHLFWLEGISDEYLEKIYVASTCLIAASEGEGFGLPLIEAAQHKLPIIARDIPVFREVAGEHAYYFNGLDPRVLADTLKHWLTLSTEGKAPQSEDMSWLTWRQSAQQLFAAILPNTDFLKNKGVSN